MNVNLHPDPAKTLIGACEWVSLPDLHLYAIKARVDTGAKTSALHATRIRRLEKKGRVVGFYVHAGDTAKAPLIYCEAPIHDRRRIKNTSGEPQRRYIIRSRLMLGGEEIAVELSLANRKKMSFPMLLGREALRGRYLVDPSHVFLHGKPRNE